VNSPALVPRSHLYFNRETSRIPDKNMDCGDLSPLFLRLDRGSIEPQHVVRSSHSRKFQATSNYDFELLWEILIAELVGRSCCSAGRFGHCINPPPKAPEQCGIPERLVHFWRATSNAPASWSAVVLHRFSFYRTAAPSCAPSPRFRTAPLGRAALPRRLVPVPSHPRLSVGKNSRAPLARRTSPLRLQMAVAASAAMDSSLFCGFNGFF
jgi:hypothetical protein